MDPENFDANADYDDIKAKAQELNQKILEELAAAEENAANIKSSCPGAEEIDLTT